MKVAALIVGGLAAALKIDGPRHIRVVVASGSQTLIVPFVLQGSSEIAQVSARCPPGFPAQFFHKSNPATSLCGTTVKGSTEELNKWALGLALAGPPLPTESAVTLEIRQNDSQQTETVTIHLATVTSIGVAAVEKDVRLVEEGRMHPAATLDMSRLPPNVKLTVVPSKPWPRDISAFFIGRHMYLRPEVWPLPFSATTLEFRIKDERSSLLSRPITLQVGTPGSALGSLSSYLVVFSGVVLFLFCSLLYVLFAVFRLNTREPAPEEPASQAVSRWNKRLLAQIKSQQSFASTQAHSVELAFRDVTLDRISPLELSQATAALSVLEGLSTIVGEEGWAPAIQ